MRNLKDIIIERMLINRHKHTNDIFNTIEPLERCYTMFQVQHMLIVYEKRTSKSYDLTTIYNELPTYTHGKIEYEIQDITATNKDIWLGVINTVNGRPNEFEFASLGLLATILGKGSTSKGFAVINYIVDDIENMLK